MSVTTKSKLGFQAGDRVIEDWDFGDREPRTGTVRKVREGRWPSDKGTVSLFIRWDEDAWPKCTQLPEHYLKREDRNA